MTVTEYLHSRGYFALNSNDGSIKVYPILFDAMTSPAFELSFRETSDVWLSADPETCLIELLKSKMPNE